MERNGFGADGGPAHCTPITEVSMFSTLKTALVLVLACSALTACGAAAAAPTYTSESFVSHARDGARRDVALAPLNRTRGGI